MRLTYAIGFALASAIGASPLAHAAPDGYSAYHSLSVKGGVFHGPGRMPDSPLPVGRLGHIEFDQQLIGETQFFNNGAEPPNIASEALMGDAPDGRLSNGRPFNEHIEGGIAEVGRGAMRFLTVVAGDGPNKGREVYRLGRDYNWHIRIDMALDPGFPEGIVVTDNLHITTGLVWTPSSLQSAQGLVGGTDQAGSLPSGAAVIGRLGDYDMDGFIDGRLVGVANVPLGHIFTPGEPVVQVRDFVSDIPIKPLDAALLSVAGALNYRPVWAALAAPANKDALAARLLMEGRVDEYLKDVSLRLESAAQLLSKAPPSPEMSALRDKARNIANDIRSPGERRSDTASKAARNEEVTPADTMQAIFERIDALLEALIAHTTLRADPNT